MKRKQNQTSKPPKVKNGSPSKNSNLISSLHNPNQIIIKKKEIWNILNDIKLNDNILLTKKLNSEDSNSLGSLNSKEENILKVKVELRKEKEEENSPNLLHPLSSTVNDAGSGSILENNFIKSEEPNSAHNTDKTASDEKENILRLILNDIHQCQFSEIFKIFAREINNPETLDYFVKLKESLLKEDTDRLLNMLVFLVWSLRYMKIDEVMMKTSQQSVVTSYSFCIGGNNDSRENQPLNFNSSSGTFSGMESRGSRITNESKESHPKSTGSKRGIATYNLGKDTLNTPYFTFHNNTAFQNNLNNFQIQNLDNNLTISSRKNQEEISGKNNKSKKALNNENMYQNNFDNKNTPDQNKLLNPQFNYPFNTPMIGMPMASPNGSFFVPLNLYPPNLLNNFINQADAHAYTPMMGNIMNSNVQNNNTSSYYKTELVKTGNLLYTDNTVNTVQTNQTQNFTLGKKRQSTYDQMSLNDSNSLNTLNTLNNSSLRVDVNLVKKEMDVIDITSGDENPSGKSFDKIYKEIVEIFKSPITDETFRKLRNQIDFNKAKKLEEFIKKNPINLLAKKQYILLHKNHTDQLYLKMDPLEKKYSITRSILRNSVSKDKN